MNFYTLAYSIDNLKKILIDETESPEYIVEQKLHLIYFEGYFKYLSAKTILVEKNYIDRDYLEDFSAYYVRSHGEINRKCCRIHFFTNDISNKSFREVLVANSDRKNKRLQENYLGFIVLKPLPKTIIGRTCLKNYPQENTRHYPFVRKYDVNLFGVPLKVNSIAYQEQDSIVAACASSALWSAFQVTGKIFQHHIPSPVDITKAATINQPIETRYLPNKGLSAEQMAQAIRFVGLEPHVINLTNTTPEITKAIIYAYLSARIPLVFGVQLFKPPIDSNQIIGLHAVTVTGFNKPLSTLTSMTMGLKLTSDNIDKIYVHDDQVGPFARMEINTDGTFTTSWGVNKVYTTDVFAKQVKLIIPVYHKIRIQFDTIFKIINKIDGLIKQIDSLSTPTLGLSNIYWDIKLDESNRLKTEILKSKSITRTKKNQFLTQNLPRYIWRASLNVDNERLEFIFDATDIEQGKIYIDVLPYSSSFLEILKIIISAYDINTVKDFTVRNMFEKILS